MFEKPSFLGLASQKLLLYRYDLNRKRCKSPLSD